VCMRPLVPKGSWARSTCKRQSKSEQVHLTASLETGYFERETAQAAGGEVADEADRDVGKAWQHRQLFLCTTLMLRCRGIPIPRRP
jgi:hypothetical protein